MMQMDEKPFDLDPDREVLYTTNKDLANKNYLIEIARDTTKQLLISAQNVSEEENFLIELPEVKSKEILEGFGNSYEEIADNLNIMRKRLVLLNPVRRGADAQKFKAQPRKKKKKAKTAKKTKKTL